MFVALEDGLNRQNGWNEVRKIWMHESKPKSCRARLVVNCWQQQSLSERQETRWPSPLLSLKPRQHHHHHLSSSRSSPADARPCYTSTQMPSLLHSSVLSPVGQTASDVLLQGFSCNTKSQPRLHRTLTCTVYIKAIIEFVGSRFRERTEPQPPEHFQVPSPLITTERTEQKGRVKGQVPVVREWEERRDMRCGLLCKCILTVLTVSTWQHRPTTAKKVEEVCACFHSAAISSLSFFFYKGAFVFLGEALFCLIPLSLFHCPFSWSQIKPALIAKRCDLSLLFSFSLFLAVSASLCPSCLATNAPCRQNMTHEFLMKTIHDKANIRLWFWL